MLKKKNITAPRSITFFHNACYLAQLKCSMFIWILHTLILFAQLYFASNTPHDQKRSFYDKTSTLFSALLLHVFIIPNSVFAYLS